MRLTRVHVPVALAPETGHVIAGAAAAHIVRVLRLRVGDSLTAFDGRGGEYPAKITAFGKGTVLILPVVCIARESDGTSGSQGPQADAAPSRRRRRRR